ncbi:MAG: hypothetical protein HZB55_07685 [Deltaproteobacteria bacterium]|nr:hypothetical protein [Deltaproteobacteria bacterium]
MSNPPSLKVDMENRPVTLHYPGAEGVVFHDAVLVVRNEGSLRIEAIDLKMRIAQGDNVLFHGLVGLASLGIAEALDPGEEAKLSVFRTMQRTVKGFGSKVNLFGYRVALNWHYDVSAAPVAGPGGEEVCEARTWRVQWRPSEADPSLVEVDVS